MEYLTLNNGIKMPVIGLGTWNLRGEECIRVVQEAISCGYRLIDTAQMYENEIEVGKGIRESGIDRKELFITTKLAGDSNSYQKAKKGIERSLQNLQVDYIDLLLLHEPYSNELDMYQALIEAYEAGKVRAIGISNYQGSRYDYFLSHCKVIPMVNQVECNVYYQKWNEQKKLENNQVVMQAWAPLSQGIKKLNQQEVLIQLAEQYHKTVYQIALKFLIQRGIGIIPKSSKVERLKENIDLFDFTLTNQDIELIQTIDGNQTLFPWTLDF